VISEIGIVDGDNGNFRPTDALTRGAATKYICNLVLGPTTASALNADTAPFPDVPTNHVFAGYIAYCAQQGIIGGYGDGMFRPGDSLSGYAFMKMLLGALGYDAGVEGFTGSNWTIQVAKLAKGLGLDKGNEDFAGSAQVTREEACLYAFNTLQATIVDYDQKVSVNVGGAEVNLTNTTAKPVGQNNNNYQTGIKNDGHIEQDKFVQFAEQYFEDLRKEHDTDAFGRPSTKWTWKKDKIGSWVDYSLMIGEYTTKVTGEDLYNLLGNTIIKDDDTFFSIYVDGETEKANMGDYYFTEGQFVKNNTDTMGGTGKGVLTQVFKDTKAGNNGEKTEISIVVINTYLAKAQEDYDSKNEDVDLKVYQLDKVSTNVLRKTDDKAIPLTVDNEDINVENVKKNDLFLVNVADGEIKIMEAPEILAESTLTNFKRTKYVTAEGNQYDYADTAMYDEEVLDSYDDKNMKNLTYNVILDPYGYMIGIELVEAPDKYVFLTGLDIGDSNLSKKNADGNLIFTDGTMKTATIDMANSELTTVDINADGKFVKNNGSLSGYSRNLVQNGDEVVGEYSWAQLNTWCTYTENSNGSYTLVQVAPTTVSKANAENGKAIKVAQTEQNVIGADEVTIDKKNVHLNGARTDNRDGSISDRFDFTHVYGNDDTVYLSVNREDLTTVRDQGQHEDVMIIDDVSSVTTGVKNVNLKVTNITRSSTTPNADYEIRSEIYTLYKDNGYVIAAVVLGEDDGSVSSYAYVTSDNVEREAYDSAADEYTWSREVVIDGKLTELKEVGDTLRYLDDMHQGEWYEVKYNSNGNVRKVSNAGTNDVNSEIKFEYGHTTSNTFYVDEDGTTNKYDKFAHIVKNLTTPCLGGAGDTVLEEYDTVVLHDTGDVETGEQVTALKYKNGTLYTNTNSTRGFSVSPSVNVVLCVANGKDTNNDGLGDKAFDDVDDSYTGYSGLEKALRDMNTSSDSFKAGTVEINAVFDSGVATTIIINDLNKYTGYNPGNQNVDDGSYNNKNWVDTSTKAKVEILYKKSAGNAPTELQGIELIKAQLEREGWTLDDEIYLNGTSYEFNVSKKAGSSTVTSNYKWKPTDVVAAVEITKDGQSGILVPDGTSINDLATNPKLDVFVKAKVNGASSVGYVATNDTNDLADNDSVDFRKTYVKVADTIAAPTESSTSDSFDAAYYSSPTAAFTGMTNVDKSGSNFYLEIGETYQIEIKLTVDTAGTVGSKDLVASVADGGTGLKTVEVPVIEAETEVATGALSKTVAVKIEPANTSAMFTGAVTLTITLQNATA